MLREDAVGVFGVTGGCVVYLRSYSSVQTGLEVSDVPRYPEVLQ